MNPFSGHLMVLANGMAAPAGYSELSEKLQAHAAAELAGRTETHVDLRKRGPLQDWAKKKRRAKIAAKSRCANRR